MITISQTSLAILNSVTMPIARVTQALRRRRAQRLTLITLTSLSASRLDDLGLNVQDIVDAIGTARHADNGAGAPVLPMRSPKSAKIAKNWTFASPLG